MLGIVASNRRRTVAVINAPTYALHTAAGVSPASWDVTGDSTFQPGMWVRQQFAADSGFTTSLVDYYSEVQGSDWEATSESIGGGASAGIAGAVQSFVQPTGTYFTRCRFETSPGDSTNNITSAWSNTVTDTIIPSLNFAWNPANKSTWDPTHQTLSNSNRTWTVTTAASGANSSIRGTLNITGNGTKVYFEFNPDVWDAAGSGGVLGVATDTYGGTGTPGSLASVGDALANLNQTAGLSGSGADLYVANAYVATPAGVDIAPANHAIGFAIRVNVSDMTLWVLKDGVCGHGDPVAGTGGYTLPFTQVKPIAALNPNSGTNQGVTINTLAAASARAPSGYTAAGAP